MFLSPPLLPTPPTPNNPGTMGGLFLDGEESPALEDISKWTVEDVCSFVSNLSGCTEYTQVNPTAPGCHGRNIHVPWEPHSLPPSWACPSWEVQLGALQGLFGFFPHGSLNLLPGKMWDESWTEMRREFSRRGWDRARLGLSLSSDGTEEWTGSF